MKYNKADSVRLCAELVFFVYKNENERIVEMKRINLEKKTILITGAAGFIGSALIIKLLKEISDITIVGIDNLNDYYDVGLKEWRLQQNLKTSRETKNKYFFQLADISDKKSVEGIFEKYNPSIVVNLAAQAGVRYSISHPDVYIQSNIIGFFNILEACKASMNTAHAIEHLVFASSSSVYGDNKKIPYSVLDKVDKPVSLYAATKKSNELMAYSYSKLYDIPVTGLRFFTVYGPAGRPDMAYYSFTNKLVNDESIKIYNYGNCKRDFTYIDDITEGIKRVMCGVINKKKGADGLPVPPYAIYNIGNQHPESLLDFVHILQEELVNAKVLPDNYDFKKHQELVPMQPGDVAVTYADVAELEEKFEYKPITDLRIGLRKFVEWYVDYHKNMREDK